MTLTKERIIEDLKASTQNSSGMFEISEDTICALMSLLIAPPAPVSVPDYPEILPCPVMLEPGLRFGKGVTTRTMLGALQRRAGHCTELEAMTPEQRAEHEAGMKEFAAMLQGSQPVSNRDELLTVCAEAYQVVGAIAEALGIFDSTEVQKVMDNLSQQKLVHADVLPFAVPGGNSPVIPDSLVMATIIDV